MIHRKLKSFCVIRRNSYRYYCVSREARFLQKFIDKGKTESKQPKCKATMRSNNAAYILASIPSKRNNNLNKVFMDHIDDLINTGLYFEKFNEYGISITQCKISKTLKVLFVYWIHTKEINETNIEEVNELLANFGNSLANMLSSFAVLSRVPTVRLAIDFQFMEEEKITNLLKTLELIDEKEKEKEIDKEKSQFQMQNEVLGLDYCKILSRIMTAKAAPKGYTTPPQKKV